MPLSFTPISMKGRWHGFTWTVQDEHELAVVLARVAIGQSEVVERILRDAECLPPDMPGGGAQGARRLLTVTAGHPAAQRDGWIFQVISWVAAHLQGAAAEEKTLVRPPQMIHAEKGQDGLLIEYSDGDIARVVICEDKATKSPRKQFRDKVLPEFDLYETGARDNELIAGVTSILARHEVHDADEAIANILWEDQRAYRVAVTVTANHTLPPAQGRLFKGYEQAVNGHITRRRVELLPLADLRPWMKDLADRALAIIDKHDV